MDGPVRQRSLWEHNLALALRQVGPAVTSRAEIAGATGLTRATVSSLVDDLLRAGLIVETDPTPRTGAGRPATGLLLSPAGPAGLGLEVNVDYLAACVVDPTGAVRHRAVRRVDQRGRAPEEVLADVATMAGEAVRASSAVAGARLAVPGLVLPDGVVRLAPNLGWRDLPVIELLTAAPGWPGLPVAVDNEANVAALGELAARELVDPRDGRPQPPTDRGHVGARTGGTASRDGSFLYVSGEVGIGAGIVLDGGLFRGTHGWSGELGHVTVTPDGPVCRCGARGCLEQYAGQEAILRAAGLASGLTADAAVARLVELATAGEVAVGTALRDAGTALGVAVAGVVNLLDVDTVVLGGSFAPLAGWLAGPVEGELAARVLTAAWAPVTVRASALGAEAAVLGAAGAVVREILAAPAAWVTARA